VILVDVGDGVSVLSLESEKERASPMLEGVNRKGTKLARVSISRI